MLRYFDKYVENIIQNFTSEHAIQHCKNGSVGGLVSKSSVPDASGKRPIMFEESVREGEKGKWGLVKQVEGDLYSGTPDHYHPWES